MTNNRRLDKKGKEHPLNDYCIIKKEFVQEFVKSQNMEKNIKLKDIFN